MKTPSLAAAVLVGVSLLGTLVAAEPVMPARAVEFIRVSDDGRRFVRGAEGAEFRPWGFNYDHDAGGRLLEAYWEAEWSTVAADFGEMKTLGANVVRVHLQVGRFMRSETKANPAALERLAQLLRLAEETGLALDVTGLGCYDKRGVPAWFDALDETGRWAVQARFWEAVAKVCRESPAVFCYDLMNEPVITEDKAKREWTPGPPLGDFYFVQRLTLDLAGRTQKEIAEAWVRQMVSAIRKHDARHLITVGVIPWAHVWPTAKPLFYAPEVGRHLDFVCVHFYPKAGEVEKALKALAVYDVGKPLVIEEMFPLSCSIEELDAFIEGSRAIAEGWIGFYWGRTIEEYRAQKERTVPEALTLQWLEYFRRKAPEMAVRP